MRLWRISNYTDLTGLGGWRFSARWHTRGRPIVYAAEHPAGALVEFLVHLGDGLTPDSFQMLTIAADDGVAVHEIDPGALPESWRSSLPVTRDIGDRWLQESSTPLLRVPSVILPDTWNLLINPLHPHAATQLRVTNTQHVPLDVRLT